MTIVRPAAQDRVRGKWSSSSGETSTHSSEPGGGISRIIALWRGLYESLAPLGYEDETGFHYGDRSRES